MNEQVALDVARDALVVTMQLAAPLLLAALVVGILVSIFQAVTQINEATLSFVPKILVISGVLVAMAPWMVTTIVTYTVGIFEALPTVAH